MRGIKPALSMLVHMRPQPLVMPTVRPTGCLRRSLISRKAIMLIGGPFNLRLSPLRSLDRTVGAETKSADRLRRFVADGGECVTAFLRRRDRSASAISEGGGGLKRTRPRNLQDALILCPTFFEITFLERNLPINQIFASGLFR